MILFTKKLVLLKGSYIRYWNFQVIIIRHNNMGENSTILKTKVSILLMIIVWNLMKYKNKILVIILLGDRF